jgi:hypothetical protein
MYYAFPKVVRLLLPFFETDNAFMRESFDQIIASVAKDGMGGFSRDFLSSTKPTNGSLIFEYIEIRHHIEAKQHKKPVIQELQTKHEKLHKLSLMVV